MFARSPFAQAYDQEHKNNVRRENLRQVSGNFNYQKKKKKNLQTQLQIPPSVWWGCLTFSGFPWLLQASALERPASHSLHLDLFKSHISLQSDLECNRSLIRFSHMKMCLCLCSQPEDCSGLLTLLRGGKKANRFGEKCYRLKFKRSSPAKNNYLTRGLVSISNNIIAPRCLMSAMSDTLE